MKIAWATDVHLDHAGEALAAEFCRRVAASGARRLLVGGDIGEAGNVVDWLTFLVERVEVDVAFVLGNHDYYGGSVAEVRAAMGALSHPRLQWLPAVGVVPLTAESALVGHGGWGDARIGDFAGSRVALSDYVLIEELRHVARGQPGYDARDPLSGWEHKPLLARRLADLGAEAAEALRPHLEAALGRHEHVIVLTHVPPFREACWHQGSISNDDWLPGFTCQAMGDLLLDAAGRHPDRRISVLCGHTHGDGQARPAPNLHVRTGRARYGHPDFEVLEIA